MTWGELYSWKHNSVIWGFVSSWNPVLLVCVCVCVCVCVSVRLGWYFKPSACKSSYKGLLRHRDKTSWVPALVGSALQSENHRQQECIPFVVDVQVSLTKGDISSLFIILLLYFLTSLYLSLFCNNSNKIEPRVPLRGHWLDAKGWARWSPSVCTLV